MVNGHNIFHESGLTEEFIPDAAGLSEEFTELVFQDTIGLSFSAPSGFYDQSFTLEITPADPAWNVYYTLDGSNPQDSETAIISAGGATIEIDPQSISNRDATPAVLIRASAGTSGIRPSFPEARTYIYLDEVLTQSNPGGSWPDYNVNGQLIDLKMDSRIVNHATYKTLMVPSFMDIPTLSIITDIDHLFDPATGIYVNAWGHGYEWERECSAELIQPDGSEGFKVNAGLRIRGGWSRHDDFPKHSFRLFFRSEYGNAKLVFPLFGDEGVDSYDKIDLRTSQNYSWAQGDRRNTMLRDVFSRDTQRDMEQPYTRSRYFHLYLNGMYWGLYQTQERSEARFAADYFGGKSEDYDVIKVNTEGWDYSIEATDGDFVLWNEIWEMCQAGFTTNKAYYKLEGKDSMGNPVADGQVYVDIDNLIDYMLSIFYTGNFDAPTSSFMTNRGPNNFYAINSRKNKSKGFVFFNHDAEHSMFSDVASPGRGLSEDRVNLATQNDGPKMQVSNFSSFHPQWLHYKLTSNAEYKIRFIDRAYTHLRGNGALTTDRNKERVNSRAAEIETAIVAESARWGDSRRGTSFPYTRDDNWIPQMNKILNDFIPYRNNILIGQLGSAGLYSKLKAASVYRNGTLLEDEIIQVNSPSTLLIKNPNSLSTIYYTIDGSDPRYPGGGIAPEAVSGGQDQVEVYFEASALLKSRIHFGGEWSPIKEIKLISTNEDYSSLAFTEIHYHPEELIIQDDTIISKELEFIELKNIGENAIALAGLVLDSAIYYEFHPDDILVPGAFYVVASKPSKFYLRYGMVASGNYQKNLSNGGEEILLNDPQGNPLINFFYSDDPPWPVEPDGIGNSLVSTEYNPTGNPSNAAYWASSINLGGSPFANEPSPANMGSEKLKNGDVRVYPNPTSDLLNIRLPIEAAGMPAIINVYDIKGKFVFRDVIYGSSTIQLSGRNLSSGIYLIRIQTDDQVFTRKIVFR